LIFVVSPLSTQSKGERAKNGWLGIRIMYLSEATCLPTDCCFNVTDEVWRREGPLYNGELLRKVDRGMLLRDPQGGHIFSSTLSSILKGFECFIWLGTKPEIPKGRTASYSATLAS
jgi:hypothetical protein